MEQRDYYELLEISRSASDTEIKKAYRKMAMKHHPDRNLNDEASAEKFKEIQKAYAVLSDAKKRSVYDQYGHSAVDSMGGGGSGFGGYGDMFEDLFETIFSGHGSRKSEHSRGQRGNDLQYNLEMTLEEAAIGKETEIAVPRHGLCKVCEGSGAKKGSKPANCETCDGIGQVRIQQGFFSIQQTCPHCHGEGKVITDPCEGCRGQGRVRESKNIKVTIPAGVDNGDRLRLNGEGEAGLHGGSAGDLYVQVTIKPHSIFERHDTNLHCEVPISFVTAALGGTIEVPTLEGRVSLKIPPETQTSNVFRLRGKGIQSARGYAQGDLLCKVVVETPVKLSNEQKELLTKFQESLDGSASHSPKSSSWFAGLKNFFENL